MAIYTASKMWGSVYHALSRLTQLPHKPYNLYQLKINLNFHSAVSLTKFLYPSSTSFQPKLNRSLTAELYFTNPPNQQVAWTKVVALDHYWNSHVTSIFGEEKSVLPRSARHMFNLFTSICGSNFIIGACVASPFVYEVFLKYHLKLSALLLAYMGASSWGLEIARYGYHRYLTISIFRYIFGIFSLFSACVALFVADASIWHCHQYLIFVYTIILGCFLFIQKSKYVPKFAIPYILRFLCVNISSLGFGYWRGHIFESSVDHL